jgi:tetratricopeptide (TPR) repeat protein
LQRSGRHPNLGGALKDQGKLDEAIAEFREAIRLEPPRLALTHLVLGLTLRDEGKRQEAIAELRMAGDNAERGSELARFIEESLNELDRQADRQLTSSRV